jgi:hypothetical protein
MMNQPSRAVHDTNEQGLMKAHFLNFLGLLSNYNIRLHLLQHPPFGIQLEQDSKVPPQQN